VNPDGPDPSLSDLYRHTHRRITTMVTELDRTALHQPVPACPGWSVRDVVSHLTAVAEDIVAGRLTGPPSDQVTAEQVARHRSSELAETLASWDTVAPSLEEVLDRFEVWPAVLDAATHEQDIRGALGRPGARRAAAVRMGTTQLLTGLQPPIPLRVVVEDAEFRVGPDEGDEIVLITDRFEALRWRMGRRSRAQLLGMEWSGDPSPVLGSLAVFGPAAADIVE
jgi:uncharacterized protein (TIGR03083 family)